MKNKKVLCALSGGVDSAVAALLLKRKGYKVAGITFKLFCQNKKEVSSSIKLARKVCQKIGIAHYLIDLSCQFEKKVIQNFIREYLQGRTPNPCVRCNQLIKIPFLISYARKLGFEQVATGHYVRKKEIWQRNNQSKIKIYQLFKAKDKTKDQSYFLWTLGQKELKYILFPLGDYSKKEVRKLASGFDLPVSEKPESQEICFIKGSYFDFLKSRVGKKIFPQGPIFDLKGKKIGTHKGLPFYTIGQRKGLGGGRKKPLFVIKIDKKNNSLIVGEEKFLYQRKCLLKKVNFIEGQMYKFPLSIKAKIRYNTPEKKCQLYLEKGKVILKFISSQRAITPGQSAVFYQKEKLLGGGIIDKVLFD